MHESIKAKAKNIMELYYYWLFEDDSMIPPDELIVSKQITHKTLITTFLLNPQLNSHIAQLLSGFNIYHISKKDLLIRLKQLVKHYKVSKYDFWTLAQKKPHQDPLAKPLWEHFGIKPQDIPFVKEMLGEETLKQLCGQAKKAKSKEELDFFTIAAKQTAQNVSNLHKRLQDYKQWIIDLLSTKNTTCLYENCKNCPLRNQPFVPPDFIIGDDSRDEVDILIIGMNPYKEEKEQGRPFVGQSGRLLRKYLAEMFPDKNIVITNSAMCYIPDNGDPDKQTLECCKPLLKQQISKVKPKVVVPLGALATQNILEKPVAITKVAGQRFVIEVDDG